MDRPYTPISCEAHDRLLALATLKQESDLTVAEPGGGVRQVRGLIVDVYTRSGAEYLALRDGTTIRLDRIRAVNGEAVRATS